MPTNLALASRGGKDKAGDRTESRPCSTVMRARRRTNLLKIV